MFLVETGERRTIPRTQPGCFHNGVASQSSHRTIRGPPDGGDVPGSGSRVLRDRGTLSEPSSSVHQSVVLGSASVPSRLGSGRDSVGGRSPFAHQSAFRLPLPSTVPLRDGPVRHRSSSNHGGCSWAPGGLPSLLTQASETARLRRVLIDGTPYAMGERYLPMKLNCSNWPFTMGSGSSPSQRSKMVA